MNTKIPIAREDGIVINAEFYLDRKQTTNTNHIVILANGFPKTHTSDDPFYEPIRNKIHNLGLSTLHFEYTHCGEEIENTSNFSFKSAQEDIDSIVKWVQTLGYKKVSFIAEGLGAPIIFSHLPKQTVFCILFWPAFDLESVSTEIFKIQNNLESLVSTGHVAHKNVHVGLSLIDGMQKTDITAALNKAETPTLVFYGAQDTVIPEKHLEIARKHLTVPRLDITCFDQGEHGFPDQNHRNSCLEHIQLFIDKYVDYKPKKKKPHEKLNSSLDE